MYIPAGQVEGEKNCLLFDQNGRYVIRKDKKMFLSDCVVVLKSSELNGMVEIAVICI